jgi:hypothetical protein
MDAKFESARRSIEIEPLPSQEAPASERSNLFKKISQINSPLNGSLSLESVDEEIQLYLKDPTQDSRTKDLDKQLKEIQKTHPSVEIKYLSQKDLNSEWVEDLAIRKKDKSGEDLGFLVGNLNSNFEVDRAIAAWSEKYSNVPGLNMTLGKAHSGTIVTTEEGDTRVSNTALMALELNREGYKIEVGKTIIEGGNLITSVNSKGEREAIIGENSIEFNRLLLKESGLIDLRRIEQQVQNQKKPWPFSEKEIARAKEIVINLKPLQDFSTDSKKLEEAILTHLVERDQTLEYIAKDLGVPKDSIKSVSQAKFHIDMSLRFIRPGEVAVNDPALMRETLRSLLAKKDLSGNEREKLTFYQTCHDKLFLEESMRYERLIEELKDHGYKVIRTPGVLNIGKAGELNYSDGPSKPMNTNIMNGVLGKSENESLFLTNTTGSKELNKYLENWLKNNWGVDKVYFLNHDLLKNMGGFDCITISKKPDSKNLES